MNDTNSKHRAADNDSHFIPTPTEWAPLQLELLEWFRKDASSLAPAYEAAVRIVGDHTMPARLHLVCHIVRDIYSKLPEILDASYRRTNFGDAFPKLINELQGIWNPIGKFEEDAVTNIEPDSVRIPVATANAVENILHLFADYKDQPSRS